MQTMQRAEPGLKKVFRELCILKTCTVLYNNEAEKRQAPKFTVAKIDGASLFQKGLFKVLENRNDSERPVLKCFVCNAKGIFLSSLSVP